MLVHYSHTAKCTGLDPGKRAILKALPQLAENDHSATTQSKAIPSDFRTLSHLELVRFLGDHPGNNAAWHEFRERFHKRIYHRIVRTCKRIGYREGVRHAEDLTQEVYIKLLNKNAKALKTYEGLWENTVYCFLDVIAERTAKLNWERSNMQKRIPQNKCKSIHAPVHSASKDDAISILGTIDSNSSLDAQRYADVLDALQVCLGHLLRNKLHGKRDMQIFHLYFVEGQTSEEIAQTPEIGISPKRVANRITELKRQVSAHWRKYVN